MDHANTRPRPTHSLTFTHCFSYFKFKHIHGTLNSCPCTLSPFCQGFHILSNQNRKPHTSNSIIIGWSTGESTGVPIKVQIGQTTVADGLFTEAGALYCAPQKLQGLASFICLLKNSTGWTQNSTSIVEPN